MIQSIKEAETKLIAIHGRQTRSKRVSEDDHVEADAVLLDLIEHLAGTDKISVIFHRIKKWYA